MTNVRRRKRGSKPQRETRAKKRAEEEPDPICCGTCLYLDQGTDECHRLPPAPIPLPEEDEVASEWPPVADETWCGAWVHVETREPLLAYLNKHEDAQFGDEPDGADEEEDGDD